jgi:hypothetical protein
VLRDLLLQAPAETITFAWLVDRLGQRSFGLMLLLLGLMAALPGASIVVGVLIAALAFQMIVGRRGPVLPRFLAAQSFKTQRLAGMLDYAVPSLRYLEKYIRPRWQAPFGSARRLVGVAIMLVGTLLFAPIPLSNVLPALAIMLLAFAYLEEDGILLCVALVMILVLLLIAVGAAWQAMSVAGWVTGPYRP